MHVACAHRVQQTHVHAITKSLFFLKPIGARLDPKSNLQHIGQSGSRLVNHKLVQRIPRKKFMHKCNHFPARNVKAYEICKEKEGNVQLEATYNKHVNIFNLFKVRPCLDAITEYR